LPYSAHFCSTGKYHPAGVKFKAVFKDQDFSFSKNPSQKLGFHLCPGFYLALEGGDSNDLRNS
jgi:hypothetical protein